MNLKSLVSATDDAHRRGFEEWFPPEYSRSEPKRMRQRQEALKAFVFGPLRTHDITDEENPIKPVPRMPYLEHLMDCEIRESNLIVPKVRRMIQTLSTEGRCMWGALEYPLQKIVIINQSEADGARHVEEDIKNVMYVSLPADVTDQFNVADAVGKFKLVEKRQTSISGAPRWIPWNSWIQAFPATARQLRGEGASGIFWDEFATHPNTRASCKAILPVLFGRTKKRNWMIRMGTVNPDTASGRHFMELYERDNFKRARMTARYGVQYADGNDVA